MHSLWLRRRFLRLLKFQQIKERRPNFWEGTNSAESLNCLPPPPPSTFNYKTFKDPNSLSFIRFQYTLHDAGVIFSESSNFYNLMAGRWDLITGGRKFCRKSELFGPPFCISILNTQNLGHSINFSVFCTIQHCFSQSLEIYIN